MRCFSVKSTVALIVIIVLSLPGAIFGLDGGTSNADFMKIGAGARPSAMGEAFTGVADDSNASFWNPAGITAVEKISITYMYLLWYQGSMYHYLSFVMPIDTGTNFGVSINALMVPGFDSTDQSGFVPAEPASSDIAVTGTFAKNLGNIYMKDFVIGNISLGANLKIITRSLVGLNFGTMFFADIGIMANITDDMKIGFVLQDIGTSLKDDPPPFSVRMGSSYNFIFSRENALLISADIVKPIDLSNPDFADWYFGIGAEAKLFSAGYLRGGYKFGRIDQGLTMGAGLTWGWGSLDYAYLPHLELGTTHRISVSFKLGNTVVRPVVGAPQQPKNTNVIAGDKIVAVGWTPNSEGNIIGYNIYYREKGKGRYVKLNTEPIMEEGKFKAVLNNNTAYSFVVTAINNRNLESVYSVPVEATPRKNVVEQLPMVKGLMASAEGNVMVVTWNESNSGVVAGFNLYCKKEGDARFKKLNGTVLRETKATLGGLKTGVKYFFRVSSVSKEGAESGLSETVARIFTDEDTQ